MIPQKLASYFRGLRFKTKLTALSAALASLALLLASVGLLGLQFMTEERLSSQRHQQIMQVISANTAPALLFADKEVARENLMSVEGIDDVLRVWVEGPQGEVFASYDTTRQATDDLEQTAAKTLDWPIVLDTENLGQLRMEVSDRTLLDILADSWFAVLVLFSLCLLLSMGAARFLNTAAFQPIERLSDAMKNITASNDYRLRVEGQDDPDFAAITENFNTMVAAVEVRDAELTRNTKQLREARDKAENANVAKSQFLANMSHELRTPLNAIIGYTEVLETELKVSDNSQALEDVNWIHSSAQQLLGLINSILDLSKIEAGRMDLDVHEFRVAKLLHEVEKMLAPTAAQQGNGIHVEIAEDIGTAHLDSVKLRQALLNLGSNACKFTQNGQIFLLARRDGEQLVFSVSDTGIGMDQQQVDKLFQPFSQADASTTRRFGGTGLGLAITQRFVQMMKGKIEVESAVDAGSTFTIRLPARLDNQEQAPAQDLTLHDDANQEAPDLDKDKPLALIIDDEPSAAQLLLRLAKNAGYETLLAENGKVGLSKVRRHRPNLVLLDMAMPQLDGWSVLDALRNDAELKTTPVVVVSVSDERNKTIANGASDHLIKPISHKEITNVLTQYASVQTGRVLVVDDDRATAELYSRGLAQSGFEASFAGNGLEAKKLLSEEDFDFLVTDLRMPELDGYQLIDWIAMLPEDKPKPSIIAVTGKALDQRDLSELAPKVSKVLEKNGLSPRKLADTIAKSSVRDGELA